MLENIEDRSEKLRDNIANHQLCEQALKVLTLLIQSSCASLKLEAYTVIITSYHIKFFELFTKIKSKDVRKTSYI